MGHGNSVFLWNETETTNCKGGLEKDVFETLLSVFSNLATLNRFTEVMQQKRLRGCIISRLFICLFYLEVSVYAELYNITRRGLACVAYP